MGCENKKKTPIPEAFRVSEKKDSKTAGKHKKNIGGRGRKRKRKPVLSGTNLHYEVGGTSGALG